MQALLDTDCGIIMDIKVTHSKKGELNLPTKDKMLKAGLKSIDIIRKRTIYDHKDVSGKSFKPYTKEYKEYKQKKRPGFTGVDLQLTGRMFANLKVKEHTKEKAVVGFSGIHAIKAFVNDKTRHFFALSKAELRKIIKLVFGK